MRRLRVPTAAIAAFGITVALSGSALALSSSEAQGRATLAVQSVESGMTSAPPDSKLSFKAPTPAERVAAGDMLLRNKDYDRAIEALSKVLELYRQGKAPEAAYADASVLLGEGYMQTKQYLSARRHFREVLDNGTKSPYDGFVGKALSRLVDIALRTDDLPGLDYVFERLSRLPATDRSGSLAYARAKALYAKKDYAASKAAVNVVPAGSPYTLQAQYLLGVVLLKEALAATPAAPAVATPAAAPAAGAAPAPAPPPDARFVQAIEQFRKVTRIPATTPEQEHVVDLAWMAIGRLFYETNNYLDSVEAYSHVGRNSPEFSTTLYELAWVFVRLGDYSRAQRALEVLTITDPNNLELADGSLLRADLMLRSGDFQNALNLYRNVRDHFDPIRKSVDDFLASTSDPAVYYDKLTADEATMATETKLPKVVMEWARAQAEDQHVFGMIDDVTRSRDLVKRSRKLAVKLDAVLSVPTRAKAFPELRNGIQYSMSLMNKLAKARATLAEGMDDAGDAGVGGELGRVRGERRALQKRLAWLPVTDGDFLRREDAGDRQWNKTSQVLQSLTVEADKLAAIVNGLKRVMKEADQYGVTADATSRERFKLEIEANERDLATYAKRIEEYRDAIENGRAQIGFGDQRYVDDDEARKKFRELFTREVALVASGQDSGDARDYAKGIQALLGRIDIDEQRIEVSRSKLERQALEQAQGLRQKIAAEVAALETYAQNLDSLDQQARLLVGEIAMKNFALVRDRVKNIVLRADVGIVQQAWEVREEQRVRVRNLQRERAREEQNLNDELREVLDDSEDER